MTTRDPKPPTARKRRFQFNIRTLLIAFFFVACAMYWLVEYNKLRNAREEYSGANAAFEAGVITFDSLVAASEKLCRAEEGMPFADKVRARALNVARIAAIAANFRYSIEYGDGLMGASTEEERQAVYARLEKLDEAVNQAQQRLRAAQE
jgi:hypothetical protein